MAPMATWSLGTRSLLFVVGNVFERTSRIIPVSNSLKLTVRSKNGWLED